ncbi:DUF2189 domain-containing protein [Faecalibacter bovis]|uniref:DUF975 family protein n=1 Tax=Faecalibacter bovis TaxID=2898187 RepID=A0ABX7XEA6_9FLAO|nr:hypothetical protein [Faecalibacter bovis]QTV06215.1 hypothetical protein J9309_02470 [Faecalibacter bovis]
MKHNEENNIQQLINGGYKAQFGAAFSDASEIFKGIAGFSILAFIIYFVASTILSSFIGLIIPGNPMNVEDIMEILQSGDENLMNELILEANENPNYLPSFINYFVQSALYPILYSVFVMARKYDTHLNVDFSDIFVHYRDGKFLSLFLLTISVNIIAAIGMVLCLIPGILVYIFLMLSIPLVIFADANVKEAIKYSYKIVSKDFGTFAVALLAIVGILIVGFLLCCVGIVAAMPFTYIIIYALYKQIIGFPGESSEIDEIGTDIYKDNPYMK